MVGCVVGKVQVCKGVAGSDLRKSKVCKKGEIAGFDVGTVKLCSKGGSDIEKATVCQRVAGCDVEKVKVGRQGMAVRCDTENMNEYRKHQMKTDSELLAKSCYCQHHSDNFNTLSQSRRFERSSASRLTCCYCQRIPNERSSRKCNRNSCNSMVDGTIIRSMLRHDIGNR